MPPKRGTRKRGAAATRAANTSSGAREATPSSSTRDATPSTTARGPSGSARVPPAAARGPAEDELSGPAVVGAKTPGPSRFSTSYGAESAAVGGRPDNFGDNLSGAVGSALDDLRDDIDADDRVAKGAAGSGSDGGSLWGGSSHESLLEGGGSDDNDSENERSPPAEPDATPYTGGRITTTIMSRDGYIAERASYAPSSAAATTRSFNEESRIYGNAGVTTPILPKLTLPELTLPTAPPAQKKPLRAPSHSPTRRSSRLAARSSETPQDPQPEQRASLKDRLKSRAAARDAAARDAAIAEEDEEKEDQEDQEEKAPSELPDRLRIARPPSRAASKAVSSVFVPKSFWRSDRRPSVKSTPSAQSSPPTSSATGSPGVSASVSPGPDPPRPSGQSNPSAAPKTISAPREVSAPRIPGPSEFSSGKRATPLTSAITPNYGPAPSPNDPYRRPSSGPLGPSWPYASPKFVPGYKDAHRNPPGVSQGQPKPPPDPRPHPGPNEFYKGPKPVPGPNESYTAPPAAGAGSYGVSANKSASSITNPPKLPPPATAASQNQPEAIASSASSPASSVLSPDLSRGDPRFGKHPAHGDRFTVGGASTTGTQTNVSVGEEKRQVGGDETRASSALRQRTKSATHHRGGSHESGRSGSHQSRADENGTPGTDDTPSTRGSRSNRRNARGASEDSNDQRAANDHPAVRFVRHAFQGKGFLTQFFTAICILFTTWFFLRVAMSELEPPTHYFRAKIEFKPRFYGWTDVRHNIGQFIPTMVRDPSLAFTPRSREALSKVLNTQYLRIHSIEMRLDSTQYALRELQAIIPALINVKAFWNGEFEIPEEFWQALKSKMVEDSFILTLRPTVKGELGISDDAWLAIKDRFDAAGYHHTSGNAISNGTMLADSDVERIADRIFTRSESWNTWVMNNENKVAKLARDAVLNDKDLPPRIAEMWRPEVERMMREKLEAQGLKDTIVTKEEFISQIMREMDAKHERIKEEMGELHSRLAEALRTIEATKFNDYTPAGMPRSDIKKIVDEAVRKAIAHAQMEALAKGQIKAYYDDVLRTKLNYLHMGSGALVDKGLTSPTYRYLEDEDDVLKTPASRKRRRPRYAPLEPYNALTRWEEDGECWCGQALDLKTNSAQPVDFAAYTAGRVIPQHLVVEFIHPGATFDSAAMPRAVEVWAHYSSYARHKRVREWSRGEFPGGDPRDPLEAKGFVKLGQWEFERPGDGGGAKKKGGKAAAAGAAGGGGGGRGAEVQVFKLSEELVSMDAQSSRVVVRAVSNHGGADHTCFYRLRLFGDEPVDFDEHEIPLSAIGASVARSWWW